MAFKASSKRVTQVWIDNTNSAVYWKLVYVYIEKLRCSSYNKMFRVLRYVEKLYKYNKYSMQWASSLIPAKCYAIE